MKLSYLIAVLVIVVLGIVLFSGGSDQGTQVGDTMKKSDVVMEDKAKDDKAIEDKSMMEGVVITYSVDGFTPAKVTIKKSDKVTWKNNSAIQMWPATAMHPTHRIYPGSGIEKCGTPEATSIFDACKGIVAGGSYSFTFDEIGTWNYHDHLTLGKYGSVVVEE